MRSEIDLTLSPPIKFAATGSIRRSLLERMPTWLICPFCGFLGVRPPASADFFNIVTAQFFSSLADSTLLSAAHRLVAGTTRCGLDDARAARIFHLH